MRWIERVAIVRGHGDDISMPDRVAKVGALWQRTGATIISHNALKSSCRQSAQLLRAPSRTEQVSIAEMCRQMNHPDAGRHRIDRALFETFAPSTARVPACETMLP